jgi:hypothetical protein
MSRRSHVTSEPGLVGAGFHPEFHALDPAEEAIRRSSLASASGGSQDQERETETENDGNEFGY